jgi:hypothetical protein
VTVAICIKCGERKIGALTRCRSCRFFPSEPDDIGRSIILSDRHLSIEDLDIVAGAFEEGIAFNYPAKVVRAYAAEAACLPDTRGLKVFVVGIFMVAVIVILAIAIGIAVYL